MTAVFLALALGCPPDTGWIEKKPDPKAPPVVVPVPMGSPLKPRPIVEPYPWDAPPYPKIFPKRYPERTRQILG